MLKSQLFRANDNDIKIVVIKSDSNTSTAADGVSVAAVAALCAVRAAQDFPGQRLPDGEGWH